MEAVQTTQPQQSWVLFMSVTNSGGKRDKIHTKSGWWLLLSCSVVLGSLQACRASLSFTISWSSLRRMSIEVVTPSNPLILCRPLLLPPSIFPSIRVFSNESVFHIRWAKYWSFSFSISPSNEHSGSISFKLDWPCLLCKNHCFYCDPPDVPWPILTSGNAPSPNPSN